LHSHRYTVKLLNNVYLKSPYLLTKFCAWKPGFAKSSHNNNNEVVNDKEFDVPSYNASKAKSDAMNFLKWASQKDNNVILQLYSSKITKYLTIAFITSNTIQQQSLRREKLWSKYYQLRTMPQFCSFWSAFMKATIGEISTPILTQHLTDLMFRKMIRQHFHLNEATTLALPPPLTETEQKAIRYAAGYVSRHTQHKLEKMVIAIQ